MLGETPSNISLYKVVVLVSEMYNVNSQVEYYFSLFLLYNYYYIVKFYFSENKEKNLEKGDHFVLLPWGDYWNDDY